MKRLLALVLAVIMVFGMLAGCGKTKIPEAEQGGSVVDEMTDDEILEAGQDMFAGRDLATTYQTYFSTSYSSLNYFSTSYATVREIVSNCVDGLVEPDKYGIYVSSLADSWDHNDDYTVWTFHIREGLKWIDHTGAETEYDVTAQDFVDGIRYIGDPLNGAYSMRVVRNLISGLYDYYWGLDDIDCEIDTETNREDLVARFDEIVGVRALDEYTVEYTLDSSAPYFLSLIESSMLLAYIMNTSYLTLFISMASRGWIVEARFFRNRILSIRDSEYNIASKCLGSSNWRIVTKNIIPQIISLIIMEAALCIPYSIGNEVFLGFVGVGMPVDAITLGNIVNLGRASFVQHPYQMLLPAAILCIITITFYLIGNKFADASDPRNHV